MKEILLRLTSRKFLLALSGAVFIILNDGLSLGIDPEVYKYVVTLLVSFIAVEGAADIKGR